MILGIVHEEFALDLHHYNGPKDIRQFCYRNNIHKPDFDGNKMSSILITLEMTQTISTGSIDQFKDEDCAAVGQEVSHESQVKFNVDDDDSSDDSNNWFKKL